MFWAVNCIDSSDMFYIFTNFVFSISRWPLLRHMANYYPVELVKTHELHPSKNYIFACMESCVTFMLSIFATEGTYWKNGGENPKYRVRKFWTILTYPFFRGRGIFNYTFGVLPFRKPVHIVGKWSYFWFLHYMQYAKW